MADFVYFGTFPESLALLAEVVSAIPGLKLLHDAGSFETNEPHWFRCVDDELSRLLRSGDRFLVAGPFTAMPLGFHRAEDGRKYHLSVAEGGPLLRGHLARVAELRGTPSLVLGDIGYQPRYFDLVDRTWNPPPEELKDAHRAIVRCMKHRLLRRRLNESFWITPDAWRLWQAGMVRFSESTSIDDRRADLPFPFPPEPIDG